jgi:3-hydroxyacyl-[acyl-carrier-protein] dehydratase
VSGDRTSSDLTNLLRRLPHRYPFLMVDRVLELADGKIVTLKNVSIDEPFFLGHFPQRPIMPGVLVVEALAQSGAVLALSLADEERPALFMLTGIDKVRLRRPVVPGDQLRMEVHLLTRHRPLWKMRAEARVDGELVAEGELLAMEVEEAAS